MFYRKIKNLLLVLLILLAASACTTKKEEDIPVEPSPVEPVQEESRLIELTAEQLKEKEPDCDYFVLLVYKDGCADCSTFSGILEKYLKINNQKFYAIEDEQFFSSESIAKEYVEKLPFIAVYNEGKILAYMDYENEENKRYYGSVAGFTEWMKDKTEEFCLSPKEKDGEYCMQQTAC